MGFLRKKVVRGKDYYLWCERKRDGKKRGGNGKVRSMEFTLGKHPYRGEWIAAYSFLGYLPIKEYLENIASWQLKKEIRLWEIPSIYSLSDKISFQLKFYSDSKPPTISMRAKRGIDLRTKKWKFSRGNINDSLKCAWRHCYEFYEKIEDAKKFLEVAKNFDSRADEVRKRISDPYDEDSRDSYERMLNLANNYYVTVNARIDNLLKRTPKKYQDEMRGKLEKMIYR